MTLTHWLAVIGVGRPEFLLVPLVLAIAIGFTAFWIWMLVDCAKRISAGETNQVGWLIAIALTQVFGAAAYLLFGRSARREFSREAELGPSVLSLTGCVGTDSAFPMENLSIQDQARTQRLFNADGPNRATS